MENNKVQVIPRVIRKDKGERRAYLKFPDGIVYSCVLDKENKVIWKTPTEL